MENGNIKYTDFPLNKMDKKIIIVDSMPSPAHLPTGTIYGYYSAFLPNKYRLIPKAHYIEEGEYHGTQTGLTRHWIKENFTPRKCRKVELSSLRWASAPLYCNPSTFKNGVYIDIKSAYSSIYRVLGWGIDYARGLYLAPSPNPLIYPYPKYKVGRSYVVSGAKPKGQVTYVRDGILKNITKYNVYSNPSLVSAVLDILSMIARFAVYACGASYYNTDGAIMGKGQAIIFGQFLNSLGLEFSIKYSGDVYISNVGSWTIGEKEVRRGRSGGLTGGDWISLDKSAAEVLYNHFQRAIEERQ